MKQPRQPQPLWRGWSLLIGLTLILSACSVGPRQGVTSPPAGGQQPGQGSTTTNCQFTAPAGQSLRLLGTDPLTLDPARVQDVNSAAYVVQIFSGLVALNEAANDSKVRPEIARSWDVSTDGLTYTFHLRPDAQFASGKAITASDFKYSLTRALDPVNESPTADTYLNDIVGADQVLAGKATEVSGIQVIDDHTLKLTINAPKPYFLFKLTYPTAYVIDKAAVDSGGRDWATTNPNGSGPFKLSAYGKAKQIILARNEHYYGTKTRLDTVSFNLQTNNPQGLYEQGQIDITGVGADSVDRIRDPKSCLNKELVQKQLFSVFYLGFNIKKEPFTDVNVRRAFNYAIDKQKIVDVVLKGLGSKASGVIPVGMPGYNAQLKSLEFDKQKAVQELAKSKYKSADGLPPITLNVGALGSTQQEEPVVKTVVAMLKQNLGVTVSVNQVDPATFYAQTSSGSADTFQMFQLGWAADYTDPQNFLDVLFHTNSGANGTNYSNPDVDQLLNQAAIEQNQTKRFDLYHRAEQMIVNDAAWVPLFYDKAFFLEKPYVKGLTISSLGNFSFRNAYIEHSSQT